MPTGKQPSREDQHCSLYTRPASKWTMLAMGPVPFGACMSPSHENDSISRLGSVGAVGVLHVRRRR